MSIDNYEYERLCACMKLQRQPVMENALSKSSATGCLSLVGISLTTTTCQILGKLLVTSTSLRKLDVSNCMLPSLGASHILGGLARNTSISDVDMSSNNLQTNTAMKIGNFLRKNSTIKRLFLQWNSLGCGRDSFGLLCDGLKVNQSLEELDLRNNQLGPYAVKDLATAIGSNKSLKTFDLRWNTLGPGDGRELLNAVQANSHLTSIQLDGNNFTSDLALAIEQAATHNGEIAQLAQEWQSRCAQLVHHSTQLEQREGQRASGVRLLLQNQGQKLGSINREREVEVGKLESQLKEIKKRVKMLESVLHDKNAEIQTIHEMNQIVQYDKTKLQEELDATHTKLEEAREVLQQIKAQIETQQAEILDLKQQKAQMQDNLELHNAKCSDVIKATEARALSAVQRVRQERTLADERVQQERKLGEQQIEKLQHLNVELTARLSVEKQTHAEALQIVKDQAAQHEAERISMLQATMAALLTEKNALNSELESHKLQLCDLREEGESHKQDLAKQQSFVSELRQELTQERNRCSDLQSQLMQAASRQEETVELRAQVVQIHQQLSALQGERDENVRQLTQIVSTQEKHLAALRLDEAERTGLLCSAMTQYLARVSASVAQVNKE